MKNVFYTSSIHFRTSLQCPTIFNGTYGERSLKLLSKNPLSSCELFPHRFNLLHTEVFKKDLLLKKKKKKPLAKVSFKP